MDCKIKLNLYTSNRRKVNGTFNGGRWTEIVNGQEYTNQFSYKQILVDALSPKLFCNPKSIWYIKNI